jgi:hypothetical protein
MTSEQRRPHRHRLGRRRGLLAADGRDELRHAGVPAALVASPEGLREEVCPVLPSDQTLDGPHKATRMTQSGLRLRTEI